MCLCVQSINLTKALLLDSEPIEKKIPQNINKKICISFLYIGI